MLGFCGEVSGFHVGRLLRGHDPVRRQGYAASRADGRAAINHKGVALGTAVRNESVLMAASNAKH